MGQVASLPSIVMLMHSNADVEFNEFRRGRDQWLRLFLVSLQSILSDAATRTPGASFVSR